MHTDTWITPSQDLPPAPLPRPQERQRDPMPPGAARRSIDVVCCPKCSSVKAVKSVVRKDALRVQWKCQDCKYSWPEPAAIGTGRAAIP